MHLPLKICFMALCTVMLQAACSSPPPENTAIVAIAANFKPAFDQLEKAFEAETSYELVPVVGATGFLTAQISQGAPFDVLLAADQSRPQLLETQGLAIAGSRFTYAQGQLALWRNGAAPVTETTLKSETIKFVAIANPKHAPYGIAAQDILDGLDLPPSRGSQLSIAENVGQAFVFTQTRNADLGFVALSQILSLPEEARGQYWAIPQNLHTPIFQDAVLLQHGKDNVAAKAFLDYLKSPEAQSAILQMGYLKP